MLIDILYTTVTPLHDRPPNDNFEVKPIKKHPKTFKWNRNTENANVKRREDSIKRYKAVMGTEWVKTRVIERRLGYSRSTSNEVLNKWLLDGRVERRNAKNTVEFKRRDGYEWRFKD